MKNHGAFIWSVAFVLRWDYKQSEYGKVILPLGALCRLDCMLEPTTAKVLANSKGPQHLELGRVGAGQVRSGVVRSCRGEPKALRTMSRLIQSSCRYWNNVPGRGRLFQWTGTRRP